MPEEKHPNKPRNQGNGSLIFEALARLKKILRFPD